MGVYILTQQPSGGESERAFGALDDAFGTESFSGEDADKVLKESGFSPAMLDKLITGGYVSEDGAEEEEEEE